MPRTTRPHLVIAGLLQIRWLTSLCLKFIIHKLRKVTVTCAPSPTSAFGLAVRMAQGHACKALVVPAVRARTNTLTPVRMCSRACLEPPAPLPPSSVNLLLSPLLLPVPREDVPPPDNESMPSHGWLLTCCMRQHQYPSQTLSSWSRR